MVTHAVPYDSRTNRQSAQERENQKAMSSTVTESLRKTRPGAMTCIRCEFREGLAILHGKVTSFYLKQLAQEIAKKVKGVELVINKVDVSVRS